ncbi:MAG: hypothetical protein QM734_04565 [Cyclobacteriaceae bacterium]
MITKLNGSASADVGGVTTGYTFTWFKGQNTSASNSIANTSTVSGLSQGIYTVLATDNVTGCSDTDEVTINTTIVIPTLSATEVDVTHCTPYDGSATASVSSGVVTDYIFSWYKGSSVKTSTDFSDTDNVLDNLSPGVYTVSAFNSKTNCQAAPISVTVLINLLLLV